MNEEKVPVNLDISLAYKRLQTILTLDPRVFKPCHAKEVEQWSWKKMRNVKFLVHLKVTSTHRPIWSFKRLP
jgi:hypothetical protein